ncbi:histidine phosphatase family protein [Staphylococcus saprophyticus]|uniref:histidine phosphatase family protein n=1 Tax=Staphylococcus saprophyticus TaxID=29385 RepID=UPI002DBE227A|nr:histidine phosphatase family protein [Staphylococcus saprophyticus]MEB8088627.1 histidine phosphatase family protein [Staphylococcus saprophyticus]
MDRKVYFVRHAERDRDIKDEYRAPLTAEGYLASIELISLFKNEKIEKIYSSPYKRAIDTITPVSKYFNMAINIEVSLKEREIGEWVKDFSNYCYQQWNDFDFKLSDGESLNDVRFRVLAAYNKIIVETNGNIIISGHGTSISVLLNELTKHQFGYKAFKSLNMPDVLIYNVSNKSVEKIKL